MATETPPTDLATLEAEYFNKPGRVARRRIPAGQTVNIDVYGAAYHLVSSTGNRALTIATDKTDAIPLAVGTTQEFPRYFRFSSLFVTNPHAFDVDVVIWYGFGAYTPHALFLSEAPTEVIGQTLSGSTIAPSGVVSLNGVPSGNRVSRKAVLVSNGDPSNLLYLRDGNDVEIGLVFPFTAFQVEASGPVKVFNPNGTAVRASVSEIWYVSQ